MKQSLLILIAFLSISLGNAQDSVKKWGLFFDLDYGGIPINNNDYDKKGVAAGMSFGIKYKKVGFGIALSQVSNYYSVAGIGADFQVKPIKWLLLKAQLGTLLGGYGYDEPDLTDPTARESYSPDATKKFYWRGTIAFILSKYFYIGFSKMQAEPVYLLESSKKDNRLFKRQFDTLTVQLGMNITIFQKKSNKK
jgi:hypothetical protein